MKNKYRINDGIVYIELKYKGEILETMIDLNDFDLVNSNKGTWGAYYSKGIKSFYCVGDIKINNKQKRTSMHRLVMNIVESELQVDHIYHNTLDNRKSQLRIVTQQENNWNLKDIKSYRFRKDCNKWISYIKINRKRKHLGYFDNEEDAKQAYLDAKEIYHGIGNNKKSDEEISEFEEIQRIKNYKIYKKDMPKIKKEFKGYSWSKSHNRYRAYITINSKKIHIGYYKTEDEAHNAYLEAKEKYKK